MTGVVAAELPMSYLFRNRPTLGFCIFHVKQGLASIYPVQSLDSAAAYNLDIDLCFCASNLLVIHHDVINQPEKDIDNCIVSSENVFIAKLY